MVLGAVGSPARTSVGHSILFSTKWLASHPCHRFATRPVGSVANAPSSILQLNATRTDLHTVSADTRHTFAVHMLGLLLRQTIRAMGMSEDRRFTLAQIKRMLIGNPMRKLQLLLGHTREQTVYLYLDVLDEAQEIVLAALAEWDEQAAVLDSIEIPEAGL
ncbi:hypothetical protein NKH18_48565 [Streptomyces sp. M10(2022)]